MHIEANQLYEWFKGFGNVPKTCKATTITTINDLVTGKETKDSSETIYYSVVQIQTHAGVVNVALRPLKDWIKKLGKGELQFHVYENRRLDVSHATGKMTLLHIPVSPGVTIDAREEEMRMR